MLVVMVEWVFYGDLVGVVVVVEEYFYGVGDGVFVCF